MARTLAGVLAVSITALLFAACGGGDSKSVETTTTTVSKEEVCADILKKIDEAIRKGGDAAKAKAFATNPNEIQRNQNNYDLYLLEAQQLNREFEAERCPNHGVGSP